MWRVREAFGSLEVHRRFIVTGYGIGGVGLSLASGSFSFPESFVGVSLAYPPALPLFNLVLRSSLWRTTSRRGGSRKFVAKGKVPSLCTFLYIFVADGITPRPRGYTLPSQPVVDLTREAFPYRFSTSSEEMPEGAEMIQEQQAIEEVGFRREGPAYRSGWEDGRFGPTETFLENPNLAGWASPQERLAYYRGHRDGRWDRDMLAHGDPA